MAINFGDTSMEGAITPSVAVQNPVQDDSGAVLAESLGGAAKAIGAIAGSIFQQGQTDAKTKILTAYEQELLDLADSVEQGAMNRNEAMTRARALRGQYLSNSPALQEDFDKVWTNFAASNGLGHVVVQGTVEQQAQEEKQTAAIKAGYSSMTEYDAFLQSTQQHDILLRQAAAATATNTTMSETIRHGLLTSATNIADKAYPAAENQMRATIAQMEANPLQAAEIAAQFSTQLSTDIAALKASVGTEGADYIIAPITDLLATFTAYANGTVETSVLTGKMENTKAMYAAMYMNQPDIAAMLAQSALFKDVGLPPEFAINAWTEAGTLGKIMEIQTMGSVNLFDNTPASARTTANLTGIAGSITSASSPDLVAETNEAMNAAIEGAWVHERAAKDGAIGFKDLVTMLGSPEFSNFLDNGGSVTAAHADQLVGILESNYANELVPAVKSYWESVPVQTPTAGERVTPSNIPMNQLLQPVWNGSAVEFIPNEQYKSDPRIVALAESVNTGDSSIGVPLNSLINAYANSTGTDAKTIWEQQFAGRLFNLGPDGKPVEAPLADRVNAALDAEPKGDALSMGEFNPDTLEPTEEWVDQASALTSSTQALLPPIDPAYTDVEGVDYSSYLPSIRASESAGNDSARNSLSTATGRYQFLKTTWDGLVNKYPNSGLSFEGRLDPQQQEVAIRLFTAENARMLKNSGVSLSNGTLYAAHFLGASDAVKVLQGAPSDLVAAHVSARVINANPFLRGMTVAEFKAWTNRKGNV